MSAPRISSHPSIKCRSFWIPPVGLFLCRAMEASHNILPPADANGPIPRIQKHPPQAGNVAKTAPLQNQHTKKQKELKQITSQESVLTGISKEVKPVGSGRDSESSHRLSFLLQAAHLTRGISSSLSRLGLRACSCVISFHFLCFFLNAFRQFLRGHSQAPVQQAANAAWARGQEAVLQKLQCPLDRKLLGGTGTGLRGCVCTALQPLWRLVQNPLRRVK